ncbi:unnamed protein product [Eruca vesicaria subsp. sativa]|uniref:Uncharacterized protein n=1 Tax=Eruca vesicaria subsp. sativa TaxID=29727 RepID=A0ABC8JBL6_ERUVS|nr:unnamed protein product [Eruca vesicaria subsp. sativa]
MTLPVQSTTPPSSPSEEGSEPITEDDSAVLIASPLSSLKFSDRRPIESMHRRRQFSRSSRRLLRLLLKLVCAFS